MACSSENVGDHVGREPLLLHRPEELQRPLRLLALLARADQRTVGDDIGLESLPLHRLEELLRLLRLLNLLARADQRPVGDVTSDIIAHIGP